MSVLGYIWSDIVWVDNASSVVVLHIACFWGPCAKCVFLKILRPLACGRTHYHYSEVKLVSCHLKSLAPWLFVQWFVWATNIENMKFPHNWPFVRGSTGDQWIPFTKDKLYGKHFHVMMLSSCYVTCLTQLLLWGLLLRQTENMNPET